MPGENRAEYGAKSGADTEGDTLPEGHAQITHGQTESKAADSPERSEEDGKERFLGKCGVNLKQAVP